MKGCFRGELQVLSDFDNTIIVQIKYTIKGVSKIPVLQEQSLSQY